MKSIIFLILFLLSFIVTIAQDLEYPALIDAGDCQIGYAQDPKAIGNLTKYIPFYIKNISNVGIYYIGVKPIRLFPEEIENKGNHCLNMYLLQLTLQSYYLKPGEEIWGLCEVMTKFVDSISASGNYLNYFTRIYYRREDYFDIDSIDIPMRFRAVDKYVVFYPTKSYEYLDTKDRFGEKAKLTQIGGKLYNSTDNDFVVDSIKHSFTGSNFLDFYIKDREGTLFSTPFILVPSKPIGIVVDYKLLNPEESKCKVRIFGHFIDSTQTIILEDTIAMRSRIKDFLYIDCFKENIWRTYFEGFYANFTKVVFVHNYSDLEYQLTDIEFVTQYPENLTITIDTLPISLPNNREFRTGNFKYHCKKAGRYTVTGFYKFTSSNGDILNRNVVYIMDVVPLLNVTEDYSNNNILIFPNPAKEYIEINIDRCPTLSKCLTSEIRIFNVLGEYVMSVGGSGGPHTFFPSQEGKMRIDVSGLAPGLYFVRICEWTGSFVKVE